MTDAVQTIQTAAQTVDALGGLGQSLITFAGVAGSLVGVIAHTVANLPKGSLGPLQKPLDIIGGNYGNAKNKEE